MKTITALLAVTAAAWAAPALAVSSLTLDFESATSFASVQDLYAAQGVSFTPEALALANDALGPYFLNARTPGSTDPLAGTVMFINGSEANATLNLVASAAGYTGFVNAVSFDYASTADAFNLVQVYTGLNGTGQRLARISLSENQIDSGCTGSAYCNWQTVTVSFKGTAQSLVFSSNGGNIAYDNISLTAVPEPETYAMLMAGLGMLVFVARRRSV